MVTLFKSEAKNNFPVKLMIRNLNQPANGTVDWLTLFRLKVLYQNHFLKLANFATDLMSLISEWLRCNVIGIGVIEWFLSLSELFVKF